MEPIIKNLGRFGMIVFLTPNFSNKKIIETGKSSIEKIEITSAEYAKHYNGVNTLISGDNPDEIAKQYFYLKDNIQNQEIVNEILRRLAKI